MSRRKPPASFKVHEFIKIARAEPLQIECYETKAKRCQVSSECFVATFKKEAFDFACRDFDPRQFALMQPNSAFAEAKFMQNSFGGFDASGSFRCSRNARSNSAGKARCRRFIPNVQIPLSGQCANIGFRKASFL